MTRALEKVPESRGAPVAGAPIAEGSGQLRYAIARYHHEDPKLFCVPLESGEEALLVFSSRSVLQDFLVGCAFGPEWRPLGLSTAELISLLVGPCAHIDWLVLDPFPGCLADPDGPSNLVPWHRCVDRLLG